jgi:superfamily II DNA or RNA helicase
MDAALEAKRGTIKAATGTGKTVIAIAWLKSINVPSLIIVPTQALIYQSWAPKLQEAGLLDVGQFYAYSKQEGSTMITTYSSAVSHPELLEKAAAVVLDEVHHLGAQTALFRLLPKLKEKEYVLGLSSVPERRDEAHEIFLKEFPICFDLSLGDALRKRIVSPLEVIEIPAQMTIDEREKYEQQTKKIQSAFKFCGPDIAKWMRCFDPNTRQYVGRLGLLAMSRRKKFLSQVEDKKEEILKIIARHPDERIILFAESVQAIEEIKEYLLTNYISCETFHSRTEPWRRMEILEEWGHKFDVLLSCRALEEGLDVKEVAVAILITSGTSQRQFIQRIGRIIRPKEGKVARFYVVYCPDTVEESYAKTIDKILSTR